MPIHWRPLTTLDLPAVETIAAEVHPHFPEDTAVFAERQRLYPEGTRLLEVHGKPAGYILSHPWRFGAIPALNSRLGHIPADADTYYIHDLALLPTARGSGAAAMVVTDMIDHALRTGLGSATLVAVNNSLPFWTHQGFAPVERPELSDKLRSYEEAACYMVRRLARPSRSD